MSEDKRGKKMHLDHPLTDNDQQKATEKPNQDGEQEIKKEKKNKNMRVQLSFFLVCCCPR